MKMRLGIDRRLGVSDRPGTRPMPALRLLALVGAALLALLAPPAPARAAHVVVLDPGHGGHPETPGPFGGDHWDAATRTFLYPFNYGAAHPPEGLAEHRLVLSVALRARDLLRAASTPAGFPAFRRLLERYGRPADGDAFPRPDIRVVMTRDSSVESPEFADVRDANRFFRLYDSPTGFRDDGTPHPDLYPGRMSLINRAKPELCVSIHINSSKSPALRGQAAVITPNGRLFSFLRDLKREEGARAGAILARLDWFFDRTPVLSNLSGLAGDAQTYFDEDRKVPRRAKVAWRYRRSAKEFAERERSLAEMARRGGGPSLGGDNLAASDEMIRFIRLALLDRLAGRSGTGDAPADRLIGPHGLPFARDYAIPLFINAVSCYVEIGYLTNAEDRLLLVAHEEAYAEAIAVGVYSLLYGMKVHPPAAVTRIPGFIPPAGTPLDLKRYRRGRDHFQEVFPRECAIPDRVLAYRERFETMPSAKVRTGEAPAAAEAAAAGTAAGSAPRAEAKPKPGAKERAQREAKEKQKGAKKDPAKGKRKEKNKEPGKGAKGKGKGKGKAAPRKGKAK